MDDCAVKDCPLTRSGRSMCPQTTMACYQVWGSTDPEDQEPYEQWVEDHRDCVDQRTGRPVELKA